MKRYSLGFVFDPKKTHVALIEKVRPEWQRGKLNGIGGHIEEGETPVAAMRREFLEEGGIDIPEERWVDIALMRGPDWECFVFTATSEKPPKTMTEEKITTLCLHCFGDAGEKLLPNLKWLVPLCLDAPDYLVTVNV